MKSDPLITYLRTHRLRTCLTQDEVAFLLGSMSGSAMGRHEKGLQLPTLRTAIAYGHIFDVQLPELYEGVSIEVRAIVLKRARGLLRSLERKPTSTRINRKTEHLRNLLGEVVPGREASSENE